MAPTPQHDDGLPADDPRLGLDVFPLALLLGGVIAVARGLFAAGTDVATGGMAGGGGPETYPLLAIAERWPEVLSEALIAALLSGLIFVYAVRRGRGIFGLFGLAVSFLAVAAFLTGFPSEEPGVSPPPLLAAGGIALLGYGLARARFAGALALVLGILAGIGLPLAFAHYVRTTHPGMPVRAVIVDLAAAIDTLTVVEGRADASPSVAVLTPAVDQRTDTGDKVSIVMPPPATVEFTVPASADGARLVSAVGADQTVIQSMPAELAGIDVDYSILVDGVSVWSERVRHERMPAGTFDTSGMQWRHVDVQGTPGVPVIAGQTVQLKTAFAPGQDLDGVGPEGLKLGFGGTFLERTLHAPRRVATPESPNVVFIVMDTLRRDRMGTFGYDRPTTPRLDAFAKDALVFEDAYTTSSWTWPSTASLMTGLLPDGHGVKSSAACTLSQSHLTLAEALQARGYTTAAFVGNPIVEPDRYFDQGFERFDVQVPEFRMSDKVVPPAIEWLREQAPLRFFLYLHLVDPHTPHEPDPVQARRLGLPLPPPDWPERGFDGITRRDTPSDAVKQYASDLYDASVATGDRWVGEILDELTALDLDGSTIVVFTTDHGEEIFDHGFRGHGHDVWGELVRSPLMIRGPGIRPERRTGVVSNRHVVTTIADLAGAELPGHGLRINLVDDAVPDEALFETTKGMWGDYRYQSVYGLASGSQITHWRRTDLATKDIPDTDLRQFDMVADPGQKTDLVKVAGDRSRSAVERMGAILDQAGETLPGMVLGVGAGGADQLQQIGYAHKADDGDGR